MSTLHICFSPKVDRWIEVPDEPATRYCYACRKDLRHAWHFGFYDEPTYYEPPTELRCTGCGKDRTTFPGTYWEGGRPIPEVVLDRLRVALDEQGAEDGE